MSGKYLHECPEWDFLEIDENQTEFGSCLCYSNNLEVDRIKSAINAKFYQHQEESLKLRLLDAINTIFELLKIKDEEISELTEEIHVLKESLDNANDVIRSDRGLD